MIIPRKRTVSRPLPVSSVPSRGSSNRPQLRLESPVYVYEKLLVAVDGPVSSGKSALSRKLARRLRAVHLNSGLIYRSLALAAETAGIFPFDLPKICECAESLRFNLELLSDGTSQLTLHGEPIGYEVEEESIAQFASQLAELPAVRDILTGYQHTLMAKYPRVVLEGRDAGTVVAQDAHIKFFIECSLESRVFKCRQRLYQRTGVMLSEDEVREFIVTRDTRDTQREHSPLKRAQDAVMIENSMDNAVVGVMLEHVHKRMGIENKLNLKE